MHPQYKFYVNEAGDTFYVLRNGAIFITFFKNDQKNFSITATNSEDAASTEFMLNTTNCREMTEAEVRDAVSISVIDFVEQSGNEIIKLYGMINKKDEAVLNQTQPTKSKEKMSQAQMEKQIMELQRKSAKNKVNVPYRV